ncbi:MAG: glycosyltransferase family 4 protein, partial [Candidatus Wolfebacteria bacterium]|nr:glycosyltransferase family 4 protein [Candidatus Wolfebacteria bacterium]
MRILVLHQFYTRFNEPGVSRFNVFAKYWKEERYSTTVIAGGWRSALAGLFISRPSFIIASSPPLLQGLLGYALSRIWRVPFVLDVPRLSPDEPASVSCRLRRFLYSRARNVVVSSPGFKQFLVARGEVPEEKVGVVPNPIEFESIRDATREGFLLRRQFSWSDKCVVLCCGAFGTLHDFDTVLHTAREVWEEGNDHIHFVFLGNGRQKFQNVQFLDPVSRNKIPSYISAADICVVSLRQNELSRYVYVTSVLDSMSLKRPVIAAAEGVMADLVSRHAKCGISVPPEDSARMKQAILQLAKNKTRRSLLGEQGYIFAKEHFSAPALAKRYLGYLYPSTSSG